MPVGSSPLLQLIIPIGIVAAQSFEVFRMAAQRRIIGENVVGYLGQFDIPDKEIAQLGYVEEIADGADDRLCTVDFPLDGIAGDVRRGDVGGGEQVAVDSRLIFPDIQDEPAEPRPGGQQGRFIHYFRGKR